MFSDLFFSLQVVEVDERIIPDQHGSLRSVTGECFSVSVHMCFWYTRVYYMVSKINFRIFIEKLLLKVSAFTRFAKISILLDWKRIYDVCAPKEFLR